MNELKHHGIRGQKWGVRNGPPYPLDGGDYSPAEKRALRDRKSVRSNSSYAKKHFDKTIDAGETLQTLSRDKDRLEKGDLVYATYDTTDDYKYRYVFNKPTPQEILDEDGNSIGTGMFYKNKITSHSDSDLKIASEDSGAAAFKKLYKEQRDFYNFVTQRMESFFVESRYKFKGYREIKPVLEKLKDSKYLPSEKDLDLMYRMFNYVLPNDGGGDASRARDIATQRARFFKKLKAEGYNGVLDTNDALYGGYKANAPVIIFDMDRLIPDSVKELGPGDRVVSALAYAGRKLIGR